MKRISLRYVRKESFDGRPTLKWNGPLNYTSSYITISISEFVRSVMFPRFDRKMNRYPE